MAGNRSGCRVLQVSVCSQRCSEVGAPEEVLEQCGRGRGLCPDPPHCFSKGSERGLEGIWSLVCGLVQLQAIPPVGMDATSGAGDWWEVGIVDSLARTTG